MNAAEIVPPEGTGALEGALAAHRRGWRVFPLDHPSLPSCAGTARSCGPECDLPDAHGRSRRGKHPVGAWGTMAAAPQTEGLIRMWFGQGARNVGIAAKASGLVLLDEDEAGALIRAAATYGRSLPDTYRVQTSRGLHWYFRAPAGRVISNSPGALAAFHIDVRGGGAAHGGYVVGAGSAHASGTRYEAVDPGADVLDLPDWVADLLAPTEPAADLEHDLGHPNSTSSTDRWFTQDEASTYIQQKAGAPLLASRHGYGVNIALNNAAVVCGHFVPEFWTADQAREYLVETLMAGPGAAAGWTGPDATDLGTIRSGLGKGSREPFGRRQAPGSNPLPVMDQGIHAVVELGMPLALAPAGLGSWAPRNLDEALEGNRPEIVPTVGAQRVDGLRYLYPGREHVVNGEMEAGKSWFALAHVAAELLAGNRVIYVHFEEQDETSTVQRLRVQFQVPAERIRADFLFIAPEEPVAPHMITELCADRPPTLVILDGQNEAMSLHGMGIREEDGAAAYRRRLCVPFKATGAAVVSLDHVVKDREARREGYSLGSIHKGNGVDGAMFLLENMEPFGQDRRGTTNVYVTKDRHGRLRRAGRPAPGSTRKFFVGQMVMDDTGDSWSFRLAEPRELFDEDEAPEFAQSRARRANAATDARVLQVATEMIRRAQEQGRAGPTRTAVVSRAGMQRAAVFAALDRLLDGGQLVDNGSGVTLLGLPDVAPLGNTPNR